MAAKQKQKQEFKDQIKARFRNDAFLLINEMVKMALRTKNTELVDEILHSIFFLGEINHKISPREIFDNDDMLNKMEKAYPEPFKLYSSRLPRRSPFSCVLDMVVHLKGKKNDNAIRETLKELMERLQEKASSKMLFSTTICISAGSADSMKHYGVSMSTNGKTTGQILVAASCLNFWEEHVADAVMSYYPLTKRMTNFHVTIKLPAGVRCKAFCLTTGNPKPPCHSCSNMFGLDTTDEKEWPYGNCAEAESLSNLLGKKKVRKRVERNGNWTEVNQKRLRCEVRYQLTTDLRKLGFVWDNEFYIPQRAKKPLVGCCCC